MQAFQVIAVIAFVACGTPSPVATSSPSQAPTPSQAQTPSPASSPSPSGRPPNTITWPAVSAADADSFGIDISGHGSAVSSVQIKSRFGAVSLLGTSLGALVYLRIPWDAYSFVLYQALAVQAHSWTVFWFYCRGTVLTDVYWETTANSTVRNEPMTGTCTSTSTFGAKVSWPAEAMALPTPIAGFRAHGPLLEIVSGSAGSASIQGRTWTVYPYATVDCSSICGSPGWFELHSLLWDAKAGDAAFAILYLHTGQPTRAQLTYGLELPTLVRMADTWFDADWAKTS